MSLLGQMLGGESGPTPAEKVGSLQGITGEKKENPTPPEVLAMLKPGGTDIYWEKKVYNGETGEEIKDDPISTAESYARGVNTSTRFKS